MARLTVWMVRLVVRLAGACGVRRVARLRAKMAKYLFRTHYQRFSKSYFALCCTLLHSFALFVHRFVGFRTFASEIRGSLSSASPWNSLLYPLRATRSSPYVGGQCREFWSLQTSRDLHRSWPEGETKRGKVIFEIMNSINHFGFSLALATLSSFSLAARTPSKLGFSLAHAVILTCAAA